MLPPIDPTRRQLAQFGWISLIVFAAGALLCHGGRWIFAADLGPARPWITALLGGVALFSAGASLFAPALNRPLFVGLSRVGQPIGLIVTHLVLLAIFFGLVVPVGWLLRRAGRDPLRLRRDETRSTFWEDAAPPPPRDHYFRPY